MPRHKKSHHAQARDARLEVTEGLQTDWVPGRGRVSGLRARTGQHITLPFTLYPLPLTFYIFPLFFFFLHFSYIFLHFYIFYIFYILHLHLHLHYGEKGKSAPRSQGTPPTTGPLGACSYSCVWCFQRLIRNPPSEACSRQVCFGLLRFSGRTMQQQHTVQVPARLCGVRLYKPTVQPVRVLRDYSLSFGISSL